MIQQVEISVDFGFGLSISKCGGLKCLPPFVDVGLFDWGLKCLPSFVDVRLFDWGLKCFSPICWCLVIWLGLEVFLPICWCLVIWLGFEVSRKSDMGLWCYSSGVSSMLTSFNTVMGVMGLELELLAWVSALGSLCSLPSNLDQILPLLSL